MAKQDKQDFFSRFTTAVSMALGRPPVFVVALFVLIVWGLSGPLMGFSDTWQLIINTSTTIVTFLMVFIIQNTQNRDNMAINIKLDALMKKEGINQQKLFRAEDESDKQLESEKERVAKKAKKHKKNKRR
jgi:low affinity Fe/Cu permease